MKGIVFSVVGSLDPSHLLNTLRVSMQITSPAKLDSLTVESCTPPSFINVDKDRNCSSFDRVPNYGIGRIIGPITLRIHHILPVSAWTNPWKYFSANKANSNKGHYRDFFQPESCWQGSTSDSAWMRLSKIMSYVDHCTPCS